MSLPVVSPVTAQVPAFAMTDWLANQASSLEEFGPSLDTDGEDYLFAVIEYSGRVAMVLLHKSGETGFNDAARTKLQGLWGEAYRRDMDELIPVFAQ